MGNLHIVTGYKGENHVTAADIGSFQASIFGTGEYVLNRGNKFSTTVVSNNQIRVADGDILMQGRHIRMNEGTYVDLTIENGSQGYFRNDLIVARYTKDSTTGVEDCNLVVIKGTAVSADPVDPEYTTGDIIEEHVLLNDMPLYRVPLDGLNVGELVPLWKEANISVSPAAIGAATADHTHTAANVGAIPTSQKGAANGIATLNESGKVVSAQASASYVTITGDTTLTSDHEGKTLKVTGASTLTLAKMTDGSEVEIINYGANAVSLSGTMFVAGEGSATACTIDENSVAVCKYMDSVWFVAGGVSV